MLFILKNSIISIVNKKNITKTPGRPGVYFLPMKVFKLTLKITLIISLLINSAGQGYALRPVATTHSPVELPIGSVILRADIATASSVLSKQNANVVLENNNRAGRWVFRRGGLEVEVPRSVSTALGQKLEEKNKKSMLFPLRDHSPDKIRTALEAILLHDRSVEQAFSTAEIKILHDFKKVLFVAPYGDPLGNPLKYVQPNYGVATVAYRLIRELEDVDAYVYDPNLGTVDELYSLVSANHFDVIGFGILQSVFGRNLDIILNINRLSPQSLVVFGGQNLRYFDHEAIFAALPCQVCIFDDGTALIDIMRKHTPQIGSGLRAHIGSVANIAFSEGGKPVYTKKHKWQRITYPIGNDAPFTRPDLTHGKRYSYLKSESAHIPLPMDRIGRNPLSVFFGNRCNNNCFFCDAEKNTQDPPSANETLEQITGNKTPMHDSLNFECADILAEPEAAHELFQRLKNSPYLSLPKKAPACVNSVGDGRRLTEAAEAGFRILSFGIESFSNFILKKLGKKTTREQNMRVLDLALKAGIVPAINLMLYMPWDTVETIADTIEESMNFIERGAYANVVCCLRMRYGTVLPRITNLIKYKVYHLPGMPRELLIPHVGIIQDPALKKISKRAFRLEKEMMNSYPAFVQSSIAIYSLTIFKAFYTANAETYGFSDELVKKIRRVEAAIEKTISILEETDSEGETREFKYADYKNAEIPEDDAASSLRMKEYMASKFPDELYKVICEHKDIIELHSGPQSATERHLAALRSQGYTVEPLLTAPSRIRKYYRVSRGKKRFYIISNSIGFSRELFITQVLKFHGYPEERIRLRSFSFDLRNHLARGLGKYAGKIQRVVFAHEIGNTASLLTDALDPGACVLDTIKGDFISAQIVRLSSGSLVLLCNIEYTNGEHIKPVIEYMTDDVLRRGLGIKEVDIYAACGGVGEALNINDIILYSKVRKYGEQIPSGKNAVKKNELESFMRPDIGVHNADIYTIPTVLSSSTEFIKGLKESSQEAGIELELAHATESLLQHPDVRLKIIYEVHDKPAEKSAQPKQHSLGRDIPGLKDMNKHYYALQGVMRYLYYSWTTEDKFCADMQRFDIDGASLLPKTIYSLDTVENELVSSVQEETALTPLVCVAGMSGAGKTQHVSPDVIKILRDRLGRESILLSGDSFVIDKGKRDATLPYPECLFDVGRVKASINNIRQGKPVGIELYDPQLRRTPQLDPTQIENLKGKNQSITVDGFSKPLILLDEESEPFLGLRKNRNSQLAVDETTGCIIEIIDPRGGKIVVFEVSNALLLPEIRNMYSYALFIWASPEKRLSNLQKARATRTRYFHYDSRQVGERFERMRTVEDPVVLPTMRHANAVLITEGEPALGDGEYRMDFSIASRMQNSQSSQGATENQGQASSSGEAKLELAGGHKELKEALPIFANQILTKLSMVIMLDKSHRPTSDKIKRYFRVEFVESEINSIVLIGRVGGPMFGLVAQLPQALKVLSEDTDLYIQALWLHFQQQDMVELVRETIRCNKNKAQEEIWQVDAKLRAKDVARLIARARKEPLEKNPTRPRMIVTSRVVTAEEISMLKGVAAAFGNMISRSPNKGLMGIGNILMLNAGTGKLTPALEAKITDQIESAA